MRFEPGKLYFGVIDLFSVLLPGALLTWMARGWLGPELFGAAYDDLGGVEGGTAFLFGSYLLGHFAFLAGSFLDDLVYEPVRGATAARQVERLARGRGLAPAPLRRVADHLFSGMADRAVARVLDLKARTLAPVGAAEAINAFQWSKARLMADHPDGLAAVQRFEADSKFFRSLVVVLALVVPWALARGSLLVAGLCGPLGVLALWRYMERRGKATTQAYWHVLTMDAGASQASVRRRAFGEPTHGGGLVFRRGARGVEYLLVRPRGPSDARWVLPKGHLEEGESTARAAVREVREEAGVWGRVVADLGEVAFTAGGETVRASFHLMEAVEDAGPEAAERERRWLPTRTALAADVHPETREVLERGDAARVGEGRPAKPDPDGRPRGADA